MPDPRPPAVAVILAAGKGTRMRLRAAQGPPRAAGRPLLQWVVDAARAAGCDAHPGRRRPRRRAGARGDRRRRRSGWVLQAEQRGTGHALAQAEPEISGRGAPCSSSPATCRWSPPATLDAARRGRRGGRLGRHGGRRARRAGLARPGDRSDTTAASTASSRRKDATPEQLAVRLINAGLYALPAPDDLRLPRAPDDRQRPGRALPDRRRHRRRGGTGGRSRLRRPRRSGRGAGGQRPRRARPGPPPADRPPPGGADEGRGDHPGAGADRRSSRACGSARTR